MKAITNILFVGLGLSMPVAVMAAYSGPDPGTLAHFTTAPAASAPLIYLAQDEPDQDRLRERERLHMDEELDQDRLRERDRDRLHMDENAVGTPDGDQLRERERERERLRVHQNEETDALREQRREMHQHQQQMREQSGDVKDRR